MIKIAQLVEDIIKRDDLVMALAGRGLLNVSSYAREIKPEIDKALYKNVKEGSIIAAISRYITHIDSPSIPTGNLIQKLAVHSNLEGISYERTEKASKLIRDVYKNTKVDNKTYLTVTQGINEITIVAEKNIAQKFRTALKNVIKVYDKSNLMGVTVKFDFKWLETPNLIFALTRRIALKSINIVEIVSTATELTFIIDRKDLQIALEQLQKNI